ASTTSTWYTSTVMSPALIVVSVSPGVLTPADQSGGLVPCRTWDVSHAAHGVFAHAPKSAIVVSMAAAAMTRGSLARGSPTRGSLARGSLIRGNEIHPLAQLARRLSPDASATYRDACLLHRHGIGNAMIHT